jgi:hypothetical protein
MYLTAFTSAGALDPNVGGTGLVPLWSGAADAKPEGFVVQPDGKFVLGGFVSGNVAGIARLLPSGSVDPSFDPPTADGGGVGFDTFPTYNNAGFGAFQALGLLPNGDILGALDTAGPNGFAIAVAGSGSGTGSLDKNYGTEGALSVPTGFTGTAYRLAVDSDGSAVFLGNTATTIELTRFDATGTLVTGFGQAGVASPAIPGGNATPGSLVIATNGALDSGFAHGAGYTGMVPLYAAAGTPQVAIDPAGRIVFASTVTLPANYDDASTYNVPGVQIARLWP